jgi:hypothetical protein
MIPLMKTDPRTAPRGSIKDLFHSPEVDQMILTVLRNGPVVLGEANNLHVCHAHQDGIIISGLPGLVKDVFELFQSIFLDKSNVYSMEYCPARS